MGTPIRSAKAGSKVSSSSSGVVLNFIRGVCARCVGTGVSEPLGVSASSAVSGSLLREGEEHSRLLSSSVGVLSSSSFELEASSRGMSFEGDEHAVLFGYLGAAAAMIFSCFGAAYGTAKSGVVIAGVLGIYGLIIAAFIALKVKSPYYLYDGYAHLASGLACGLSGLASGVAIGVVGDAGVRANAQQPKLFVGMVLILIFAEALALYGLIVAILLTTNVGKSRA